ncbi:MAG: hypothetical protein NTW25_03145, partial [Candidatus Kapabacteria bacterium]|nr:hypothetical protein [Candidatus Kapabacteria bacterium]
MKYSYKLLLSIVTLFVAFSSIVFSALTITNPIKGQSYRVGKSIPITWDTTGQTTYNKTFKFYWTEEGTTSWKVLPLPKGKTEFLDASGGKAIGLVNTTLPNIDNKYIYIRMVDKNDTTKFSDAVLVKVTMPAPSVVDSTLKGDITGIITLSSKKIYGLDGVVYVQSGGVLRIDPGTVIKGDNTKTSAICVNRGGIIYANGTAQKPIVMTSGLPVGQRDRGDWGGLLIMGKAKSNLIESPIEGGIADDATIKKNGW